jgi:hypothetical protein
MEEATDIGEMAILLARQNLRFLSIDFIDDI